MDYNDLCIDMTKAALVSVFYIAVPKKNTVEDWVVTYPEAKLLFRLHYCFQK